MDFEITQEYTETARKLETKDKAHANLFNELFQKLLNNDAFLKITADSLAEKMLEKGMIANNLVTDNTEMVLAAPMGKLLKEQLDEQNKNIEAHLLDEATLLLTKNNKKTFLYQNPNFGTVISNLDGIKQQSDLAITPNEIRFLRYNEEGANIENSKIVTNRDLAVCESACTIPSSIDLYVSQNLVEKSANTVCLTLDFHVNEAIESASIIFVLPEGFRPRQTLFVPVLDVTTNTPNTYATIEPNGNISVASNIQTGFFAIIQKTFMV